MIKNILKEKLRKLFESVPYLLWDLLGLEIKVACFDQDRMFQPPVKALEGDAGYDIYSTERINVDPGTSFVVDTNLVLSIPKGWAGLIVPRSGLGFKYQVRLVNTVGVIDSNYRGEVKIKVSIPSGCTNSFTLPPGERFCQLLLIPAPNAKVVVVDLGSLSDTNRAKGGFGHTGTK
jgi:dUTP pyrophosphatase